MKKAIILPILISLFGFFGALAPQQPPVDENATEDSGKLTKPMDMTLDLDAHPEIQYDQSHLLVKQKKDVYIELGSAIADSLGILDIQTNKNSDWATVTLTSNRNAKDSIQAFRDTNLFETVDFDYLFQEDALESEAVPINDSTALGIEETIHLDEAYQYMEEHGGTPGGTPDTIIAVLDTGVDYDHPDLKNNIWTNTGEIPGNGIDDDGNGYIDDVRGWDCVNNDNDPMDDNGHGTHVAGIVGAEKNNFGTTGVAYNCTIMPVKCGNSSGTFNNSDIAEAIRYAYMNGADIISMSIGGSAISLEVQEALEQAYTSSFLVAAAGNDTAQNEFRYPGYDVIREYPASFSFVCGVMSTSNSYAESWFTNFDVYPNNSNEYEVFAPGEAVYSTYPNNRYVAMNGTSMATPVVSAVAALIRSMRPDKEMYPTKYLFSQIVNTSDLYVSTYHPYRADNVAKCVDAYAALAKASKPNMHVYDYYTFDDEAFSINNNANETINAGETIRMGMNLINIGGAGTSTVVTIDDKRDDEGLIDDPNIEITKDTVEFATVGTYSNKDTGLVYAEDGITVTGTENYFEFVIDPDCPDEYSIALDVTITCFDSQGVAFKFTDSVSISVSNRVLLEGTITKDTTLTKDHSYLVLNSLFVNEGVTLTIEPGVDIQFYNDINSNYYQELINSPSIVVWGTLNAIGTEDEYIDFHTADWYVNYAWYVRTVGAGEILFEYCSLYNPVTTFDGNFKIRSNITIANSELTYYSTNGDDKNLQWIQNGKTQDDIKSTDARFFISRIVSSKVLLKGTIRLDVNVVEETEFEFSPEMTKGYYWTGTEVYINQKGTNNIFINRNAISLNPFVIRFECNDGYEYDGNAFVITESSTLANTFELWISGNGEEGQEAVFKNTLLYGLPSTDSILDAIVNDFKDSNGNLIFKNEKTEDFDITKLPPFITDVTILDSEDKEVTTLGKEDATVIIEFNRDMDTSLALDVTFGSIRPYADYVIEGNYTSKREWVGTIRMDKIADAGFEGGYQHLNVTNGRADDNHALQLAEMSNLYTFVIDTSASLAMSLQAVPTAEGVKLTWYQDDYETLMGYNVYRAESENGQYTRMNNVVIPKGTSEFVDDDVEPGKTYFYQFTVVLSDMTESGPSGKTQCTVADTIKPTVIHTPVNQGYVGNNLVISVTARDNVAIQYARLYYRTKGESEYKMLSMNKSNDRYSVKIPGSELDLAGLEYYIEISDESGNIITKGTAAEPYFVTIKDASVLSGKGDVNGDGTIDTLDAMMMLDVLEDNDRILTDDQFKRADLNENGEIDASELYAILSYINGDIDAIENCH